MRTLLMKYMMAAFLLIAGSLTLSSCALTTAPQSPPDLHQIWPSNTSPSVMNVSVKVVDDASASDKKVQISMLFSMKGIINANDIEFTNGRNATATITCNGVPLAYDDVAYDYSASVPFADEYDCLYRAQGGSASIHIEARPHPRLTVKMSGNNATVHYSPSGNASCHVRVDASDSTQTINGPSKPDTGTYANIDVSSLNGNGSVTLTRECTTHYPAFHSTVVTYDSISHLPVTWHPQPTPTPSSP
jgi:hypothetical protein